MKHFLAGLTRSFWLLAFAALLTGTLATGCSKEESAPDYAAIDDGLIKKYLADKAITNAQKQPSGLYLVPVTTNASAPLATANQVVSVLYTGTLLDGTVFDATSQRGDYPYNFTLGNPQILTGFAQGVALLHKGDKAVLLVPSQLAYGSRAVGNIPANTVVRFEVELTDINTSYAVPDDNAIKKYLADNNITNAQKQTSGLYYVPGTTNASGDQAVAGKTVSVLYTGKFMHGTVFDATSLRNNTPFSFVLGRGQVIPGWDEGIALMRKGEKGQLLIPSALAYGTNGSSSIPPNTVLRFDVEVTDVK